MFLQWIMTISFFHLKTGVTQRCGKKVSLWPVMDVPWSTWSTMLAREPHLIPLTRTTKSIIPGEFLLRIVDLAFSISMKLKKLPRATTTSPKMMVHKCLTFLASAFRRQSTEWFGECLLWSHRSWNLYFWFKTAFHVRIAWRFTQAHQTAQLLLQRHIFTAQHRWVRVPTYSFAVMNVACTLMEVPLLFVTLDIPPALMIRICFAFIRNVAP